MAGNYLYEITTPKNTSETSPVITPTSLTSGLLNMVTIGFPKGCAALMRVQILLEEHVLFPSNGNNSYAWDDYVFVIPTNYLIGDDLTSIAIRTWNEDIQYPHTVIVAFNIVPQQESIDTLLSLLNFGLIA